MKIRLLIYAVLMGGVLALAALGGDIAFADGGPLPMCSKCPCGTHPDGHGNCVAK